MTPSISKDAGSQTLLHILTFKFAPLPTAKKKCEKRKTGNADNNLLQKVSYYIFYQGLFFMNILAVRLYPKAPNRHLHRPQTLPSRTHQMRKNKRSLYRLLWTTSAY